MNQILKEHPEIFAVPRRIRRPFAWVGHIPFAFYLMKVQQPRVFVELGVHTGNSFAAFCQGSQLAGSRTSCFGVDTWRGDEHAGYYEQTVYDELLADVKRNYSQGVYLLRMLFDEALNSFSDHSIDLLHIDGLHTYEAVRHDFETWLPKMSERGVVLFHDTAVRSDDFGVWKFFEELRSKYPTAEFHHSYGLGIVGVGERLEPPVRDLIRAVNDEVELRNLFCRLGDSLLLLNDAEGKRDISSQLEYLHGKVDKLELAVMEKDALFHRVVTAKDELFRQLEKHSAAMVSEKEREIQSLREQLEASRNIAPSSRRAKRK